MLRRRYIPVRQLPILTAKAVTLGRYQVARRSGVGAQRPSLLTPHHPAAAQARTKGSSVRTKPTGANGPSRLEGPVAKEFPESPSRRAKLTARSEGFEQSLGYPPGAAPLPTSSSTRKRLCKSQENITLGRCRLTPTPTAAPIGSVDAPMRRCADAPMRRCADAPIRRRVRSRIRGQCLLPTLSAAALFACDTRGTPRQRCRRELQQCSKIKPGFKRCLPTFVPICRYGLL